jgi:DNA-binding MarR family transcriptional regulator
LSTQVSQRVTPELGAWIGLLRAHASTTKRFNAELVAAHGLTLNSYEVLLHLARADGRRLRRVDLAERVLLTPSGITRLLEGLERSGYVERASCESDARVTYAQLTDGGEAKLREAAETHVAGIREFFGERFSKHELEALGAMLERLPADPPGEVDCGEGGA